MFGLKKLVSKNRINDFDAHEPIIKACSVDTSSVWEKSRKAYSASEEAQSRLMRIFEKLPAKSVR